MNHPYKKEVMDQELVRKIVHVDEGQVRMLLQAIKPFIGDKHRKHSNLVQNICAAFSEPVQEEVLFRLRVFGIVAFN
jgi:hypothetical protein